MNPGTKAWATINSVLTVLAAWPREITTARFITDEVTIITDWRLIEFTPGRNGLRALQPSTGLLGPLLSRVSTRPFRWYLAPTARDWLRNNRLETYIPEVVAAYTAAHATGLVGDDEDSRAVRTDFILERCDIRPPSQQDDERAMRMVRYIVEPRSGDPVARKLRYNMELDRFAKFFRLHPGAYDDLMKRLASLERIPTPGVINNEMEYMLRHHEYSYEMPRM